VTTYDCTRCGACCVNSRENRDEGFPYWVEIERDASILSRRDLVKKLVVLDDAEVPHLRVAPDGRCLALSGKPSAEDRGRVRCTIYAVRPHPCRRVQPGDANCKRARADLQA
jgi:Fe-S-cluster containining protein